jgi:sodium-dependent phosphate cotransporter
MDKEKFRLSFSGATVHDMFNLLTVSVLLPVELAFGFLEKVSDLLVTPINSHHPGAKEPELLNAITKPLTEAIIRIDKHVLDRIATNTSTDDVSLIKRTCESTLHSLNESYANSSGHEESGCSFLFKNVDWPDWVIGTILLTLSLFTLSTCLVCMVKILTSIFNGPVAKFIQTMVNSDLPGVFRHFTGLLAILVKFVYNFELIPNLTWFIKLMFILRSVVF